ncbi:hypothetical protein SERLA73DRAFT_140647, partial [Serpula lacrymans var. lacrymans S7.3]
ERDSRIVYVSSTLRNRSTKMLNKPNCVVEEGNDVIGGRFRNLLNPPKPFFDRRENIKNTINSTLQTFHFNQVKQVAE